MLWWNGRENNRKMIALIAKNYYEKYEYEYEVLQII